MLLSDCDILSYPLETTGMASSSLDPPVGVTRPVVFFDVSIGETPAGRIKMGEFRSFPTCPSMI